MAALRIPTVVFGAFALIWPQQIAAAREPLRLAHSSNWVVDYAEDRCRLLSEFGEGDDKITLILSQFSPGDWFRVSVAGKPIVPQTSQQPLKGRLRFGPEEESTDVEAMPGTIGGAPAVILTSSYRIVPLTPNEAEASRRAVAKGEHYRPAPVDLSREQTATWLELARLARRDIILETGPMGRPMQALRECSRDLVRSWGLDVDQQATLSRRPVLKAETKHWFGPTDYPDAMVQGGHQAVVHFRLMIDAQGRPTSCHIQETTDPQDFAPVVCKAAMNKARFEPALDANGQPVASYLATAVSFRLE